MDVAEYLPMFIAESREHLEGLGLAVVRIEERPDDRATIDEIFRIAHSFKGMSATMGYDAVAELTHAMEDVFEHHLEPLGVPILHNLPLGHGDHLCTIPLGVTATVDADARTLVIEEPALDTATGGVGTAPAGRVARV